MDLINLMTYDLHGSWETFTGQNAPLYPRSNEVGDQRSLNIDAVVNYWINNGATKSKLILGMASYGRSFTLASTTQNGLGAPANGAGNALPVNNNIFNNFIIFIPFSLNKYTASAGMASYYEVCTLLKNGWTRVYNTEQQVPYVYNGNQWIGYDDTQSLTLKIN